MTIDRTRYLTIQEAAERSGYDYYHVHKLIKSGRVKSMEISAHVRLVDWEDLERYQREKPQRKPAKKGPERKTTKPAKPDRDKPSAFRSFRPKLAPTIIQKAERRQGEVVYEDFKDEA